MKCDEASEEQRAIVGPTQDIQGRRVTRDFDDPWGVLLHHQKLTKLAAACSSYAARRGRLAQGPVKFDDRQNRWPLELLVGTVPSSASPLSTDPYTSSVGPEETGIVLCPQSKENVSMPAKI